MPGRPSLLDNLRPDAIHGDGLVYLADDLDESHDISVATGYINLGGLHHLAAAVRPGRSTRLLLGAAPSAGLGGEFPATLFERTLLALRKERDIARFPASRALKRLLAIREWLDRPNVDVRRYVAKFLHGKAYLFGDRADARAALVTSANLTAAGMWQNLELGLVHYDPEVSRRAIRWFDELWDQATPYKEDLDDFLFPEVDLLDPRTVYLRALLELFGDVLDDEGMPPEAVKLAPFQEDGFRRALGIIGRHRGVVYADGVGAGKTFVGMAFVEEYAVRRGRHVLIVVPAQLKEKWRTELDRARLPAQVVSYHGFAADEQLADPGTRNTRRVLSNSKEAYRLVIFDEAHALRNPDTIWYRAASRLLGGREKEVVLLTATPINNGLWDLYHMVLTFARHDRAFATHGIGSLRRLFLRAGANERDPENLNPDVLFPLADMVSVRRDRRFIEARYPGATFPDGTPVSFPEPRLSTERYDLDEHYPQLVIEITFRIQRLKMARYRPSRYRRDGGEQTRERTLAFLLQSGILKRFESCWHACLLTIQRMLSAHHVFLEAWERGRVPVREALTAAAKAELDESAAAQWLDEQLDDGLAVEPVDNFVPAFRDDVDHDRALLIEIEERLEKLGDGPDPKLALLRRILRDSPSEKIVVFSTFADTVRYLDEQLPKNVDGRARVAIIGTETSPDERTSLLLRFCPESVSGTAGYRPQGSEVDLLLSNDVLSEGQDLQQAGAVVSYDMPWNPQRMVQRYGRVIRLKSPHETVHLTTMLPEPGDLEEILKLEIAIRRKIVAARPYGLEVEVIDRAEEETRAYAERMANANASILDDDEESGGAAAFSGESLRADLRRELEEGRGEELNDLPWGIGAAFQQGPECPSTGAPGVFFACRAKGERHWRYVSGDEVVAEPASILRRINPGMAEGVESPPIDLEAAWEKAVASIVEEHNAELRAGASESVGPLQQWALEVLADPTVTLPPGAGDAYDALQVGRSQPVRRALGEVKRRAESGRITRSGAAKRIVDIVRLFGLRKVSLPDEGEPITAEDVGVVCWMGVLRA